jgi:thimet oligopeptidase
MPMIPDQELRPRTERALAEARIRVAAFAGLAPDTPAAEVVERFDRLTAPLAGVGGWISLLENTHPSAEVRAECEALSRELSAFATELSLDRGVYESLARVESAEFDDPQAARLVERALRRFRRAGVDRDDATRERITALEAELVELGQAFSRNIVEDSREYVVAGGHAALEGLPLDFLRAHPEREDGSVVLTTDPSDRMPVMQFAENDDLRREYFLVAMQRALPDNIGVLDQLLARRRELANLLGYADWADYATEEMMTGSADTVAGFLARLEERTRDAAGEDAAQLLELARARHPEWLSVPEWARGFWSERLRAARAGVDAREARPYFAYDRVRDGLLALSAELFGVEIRRDPQGAVWHESVEAYEIVRDGRTLARFWFDMHPRAGKYKHAAMFDLHPGGAEGHATEGAIVCNFARPTADDPALLLHDDVVTLFHEFGHLLHFLLGGDQRFNAFTTGGEIEWDFVEVPSQLYEEWARDPDVLARFALHHESGQPIPRELVERMDAADRVCRALDNRVQLFYASLSLELYRAEPGKLDPVRTMIELKQRLLPTPHTEGNWFHLSFGHLVGYSAAYYTYAWSLVIAKDLAGRFDGALLDPALAREYAAKVLEPGSSRPASELVSDFLGRSYEFDAYERWLAAV